MPRVKLTGPDGRSAYLTVPDDASEEAIQGAISGAMQNWPKGEPQSMPWSDVATSAVKNIPKSAAEFGGNIMHAVTHPVETVKALADVGYGGLSKAAGAVGVPMDPTAKAEREQSFDAVAGFFAERYGGVENFKKTLAEDPVGFAADVSTVLAPAQLATRAPGVAGKTAQTVSAASRAVDPLTAAARAIKAAGSKVVAPVIGQLTGTGAESVRTAARSGQQGNRAFLDGMRGKSGPNEARDMAQSALGRIRQDRSAAYTSGMESMRTAQTGLPFPYAMTEQAIASARKSTNYHGVMIDADAAKVIDDISAKVEEFRALPEQAARHPMALDALKRSVGEVRQKTQPGTLARTIASDIYNTVKTDIVKQVPEYATTMKGYADASDKIADLDKTFSLGERAAPDTAARKLQSVLRNNVNTNYGRRTKLLDELAQYEPGLPALLAGETMSSPTPRGLQSLMATGAGLGGLGGAAGMAPVNPAALLALPFMSPRLMGETAYGVGRGAGLLGEGARKAGIDLSKIPPWLLALYEADEISTAAQGGILGGN
jgi:hypothetical protein